MSNSVRDPSSCKHLLESLKKAAPFTHGLVLTTVPRGGLQLAQPMNPPEGLLKAYAKGFHSEDRLTWQAIVRHKPVKPNDAWDAAAFQASPYYRELMQPMDLKYVVALPLTAPVLEGYPGAVHLARTADQGDFRAADVEAAMQAIKQFEQRTIRFAARAGCLAPITATERPATHLTIVDAKLRPQISPEVWHTLDGRLREQILDQAKKRMHHMNGNASVSGRVQVADSLGDAWVFRVVAYKQYPALGDGPFAFLCLQPACHEWVGVKPADFQADAELSRLIPALRFMQQEFHRGPTLVEISKIVDLSPFHFHRRFTELLGTTPKQFLLECQIHQAKAELLARNKELAKIARDCGFAHQSHFTSRFKQATGLTPTRWRRMMAEHHEASSN